MFDNSIGFTTYNDFFKRRNDIKKQYRGMKDDTKAIYKMYLYSQRELSTNKVDLIWEFLNEPDTSCYCPTTEQLEQYFVESLEHDDKYDDYLTEDDNFEY